MYKIKITNHFTKQLERLVKKNRSLKKNIIIALNNFNKEHSIFIGHNVYKIRIQGQNKGKSAGYRLYIYALEIDKLLSPIAVYSKNEKENLSFAEMAYHLEKAKGEFFD